MSQEEATTDGVTNGATEGRLRRPPLERSEPRRGWGNLYTPGKADAASPAVSNGPAPTQADAAGPTDAAARVVRDGYRIVEENLRRGRQVAAELRGVRREVANFAGRIDSQKLVGNWAQTLLDPALTEQVLGVARSVLGSLGAVVPGSTPTPAPAARPTSAAQVPLHPQERPDYAVTGARVLKLRGTGPGEWLADLEIDGKVRRVQVRAVDGEL